MAKVYPELNATESELPDPIMRTEKKDRKDVADIRQKLKGSVQNRRFADYTNVDMKLDNEDTCLETLKTLEAAESDARKRIVYFSCLKGQVLNRLKEITGKKMSQLLKLTSYSQGYAYFLINLFQLAEKHNRLMYSDLPIRFFRSNLKVIESICEEEETFWKLA